MAKKGYNRQWPMSPEVLVITVSILGLRQRVKKWEEIT